MKNRLIEDLSLRDSLYVFKDRAGAGKRLAAALRKAVKGNETVLAIPLGGVAVACEVARALSLPMDMLIVKKIQNPWNPEAGFGAVDAEGVELFDEKSITWLNLSEDEVSAQVRKTLVSIRRRNRFLRKGRSLPKVRGRSVILVDDGIASGYTMLSAVRFLKRKNAGEVTVAVPTAFDKTVGGILTEVDRMFCPNIRSGIAFSIADAYENWYDISEKEALSLIENLKRKRGGG